MKMKEIIRHISKFTNWIDKFLSYWYEAGAVYDMFRATALFVMIPTLWQFIQIYKDLSSNIYTGPIMLLLIVNIFYLMSNLRSNIYRMIILLVTMATITKSEWFPFLGTFLGISMILHIVYSVFNYFKKNGVLLSSRLVARRSYE